VKTSIAFLFAATLAPGAARTLAGEIMPYTSAEFARLQAPDPPAPIRVLASRCHICRAEAPIVLAAGRAGPRSVSRG
jgi:hypothetical protein